MQKIKEEIFDAVFFIIRRFFLYQINRNSFSQYIRSTFGSKITSIFNLFIFENVQKFVIEKGFGHISNFSLRTENLVINKRKKKNRKNFFLISKNLKNKNYFLNEKFILNRRLCDIRNDTEWNFEFLVNYKGFCLKKPRIIPNLVMHWFSVLKFKKKNFLIKMSILLKNFSENLCSIF